MRRRDLMTALAAGLAGRAAWGQSDRVRRVGALMPFAESDPVGKSILPAFRDGLARQGWIEGKNLALDHRFAAGDAGLYKSYAAELVALAPDVILASTPPAVVAVRQRTSAIPIVFVLITDPVGQGFAQSIAHPGGNATGFSFDPALMSKWLQLLKEVAPRVTHAGVIFNPDTNTVASPIFYRAIEQAAPSFGLSVTAYSVRDDAGIEQAIAAQARETGGAIVAVPDSFAVAHAGAIVTAATRRGMPVIGPPPMVPAGALLSYFFDLPDLYGQAAGYADRILKGAMPGDLPVQEPTKYLLTINLKSARTLGLTVPTQLLQQADEVIE